MNRTTMLRRSAAFLGSVALVPLLATAASAAPQSVTCSSLAAFVEKEAVNLNKKPINTVSDGLIGGGATLSSANPVSAMVIPAGGGNLSYCQVLFQREPFNTILVGLPLNSQDGGTGVGCAPGTVYSQGQSNTVVANNSCVKGNWNGKVLGIGNGAFAGAMANNTLNLNIGITAATDIGFVGTETDNGHSANQCNAINPATGKTFAQPNCGVSGAGFVLDPNNKLITSQVFNFIDDSEAEQMNWAKILAKQYYEEAPKRTYWSSCSTGGRQGFEMAQFHPELFDGILAGSPAINWNRMIIAGVWPPVVVADIDPADCNGGTTEGCQNGVSTAFVNAYNAANAAAVADCDANDGVIDGVINEVRRCNYDAKALIGVNPPPLPMTAPMTEAEATAINMIWDGPRNQRGQRLWGGITRGTTFSVATGPFSSSLATPYVTYWMEQNPTFDILGKITTTNFATFFEASDRKFADSTPAPSGFVVAAATDSINLSALIEQGTKVIHYHGTADPLVLPFTSFNYDTRLLAKYGQKELQKFYRSYYYPGNGHCGSNAFPGPIGLGGGNFPNAGQMNGTDMFNDLINWVEKGVAPTSVVAFTGLNDTGNTTLICPYPSFTSYKGSGPITAAGSYTCTPMSAEALDLAAYDQTATQYHEAP
jgi:hypothetical protein